MSTLQCQALTRAGTPCGKRATHQHVTQAGTRVQVCGSHLRGLRKRERNGSDEEQLAAWGVTPPATPSPGQSTPLGDFVDPSPPMPVDG